MSNLENEVRRELEALRDKFLAKLPARIEAMNVLWDSIKDAPTDDGIAALVHEAHSLAGTAGVFALKDIGDRAALIEDRLYDDPLGAQKARAEIDHAFEELRKLTSRHCWPCDGQER